MAGFNKAQLDPFVTPARTIKWCYACDDLKSVERFYASSAAIDGRQSTCKECGLKRNKERKELRRTPEWIASHPELEAIRREKERLSSLAKRAANPEKYLALSRAQYVRHINKQRARGRVRRKLHAAEWVTRTREWRQRNPEMALATKRAWKAANKESLKAKDKAYREANAAAIYTRMAKYYSDNADAIKAKAEAKRKANPAPHNARTAKRGAARLRSIPIWADFSGIEHFYKEALRLTNETGIKHEVDHIVPLQSKWVCGLHCEANLAVVARYVNRSKSNRRWPDMGALREMLPSQFDSVPVLQSAGSSGVLGVVV